MFAVRDKIPMRTVTVLPLLLILLSFTSLAAQDTLTAGDKVRVTTDEDRVVGSLVSLDNNLLTLEGSLMFPLASLTKLEVSRGRRVSWAATAIGFFGGLAVGLAVGWFALQDDYGAPTCSNEPACPIVIGAFAVGGAAIGAAAFKTDRWEEVPLDRISVSLTPTIPDGFGVTVRVTLSR